MSLFSELVRRNVIRAGLAYSAGCWMLLQTIDFALNAFGSPNMILPQLIFIAVMGLPAVMMFAWKYEITPNGIMRDEDVNPGESVRHKTAKRLEQIFLMCISVAIAFLIAKQFGGTSNTQNLGQAGPTESLLILVVG